MKNKIKNKIFKITATLNKNGKFLEHFGIHPNLVSLYGKKVEDIINVEFKISENQEIPKNDNSLNPDYWGWYDYNDNKFDLIYAKYFLFDMCFHYGIKAEEDVGRGKAYRLEILENKDDS